MTTLAEGLVGSGQVEVVGPEELQRMLDRDELLEVRELQGGLTATSYQAVRAVIAKSKGHPRYPVMAHQHTTAL